MEMLTGRIGCTIIIMVFEVAGFPVGQIAEEVRIQVIVSPFEGV